MTGAELRILRLRKGYSLAALAEATGKDITTVCRYQSGKLVIPKSYELAVKGLRPIRREEA